jgi:hypothetical protein
VNFETWWVVVLTLGRGFGGSVFFFFFFRFFGPDVMPRRRSLLMMALRLMLTWNSLDRILAMSRIDLSPGLCSAFSRSVMPATVFQQLGTLLLISTLPETFPASGRHNAFLSRP